MKHISIIISILSLCLNLNAGTSVKDMLGYLKAKTDQSSVHATNEEVHLMGANLTKFSNSITNGQNDVTLGGMHMFDNQINGFYGNFIYSIALNGTLSSIYNLPAINNDMIFSGYNNDFSRQFDRFRLFAGGGAIFPTGNIFTVSGGTVTNQVITSPVGNGLISSILKTDTASITSPVDTTLYVVTNDTVYNTEGLYSEIETYNQYLAPMTTTIAIVQEKTVYKVNVTTNVVLAFDMSDLNFTNMEANFRLDLNIQHTNGFNVTFPQGWDFVPDLTVTGEYRFAVCATGPTTMHVKQVYPTVYEWVQIPIGQTENQTPVYSSLAYSKLNILTSTATNSLAICAPLNVPCIIKTDAYIGYEIYRGAFAIGRGSFINLPTGFIDQFRVFQGEIDYKYFYEPASQNVREFDYFLMYYLDTTANVNIPSLFRRQANELEISAYNAGWRP